MVGGAGAEAGDPRQPPDLRRRQRVFLDAGQGAVAGECPTPFQQTPQMGEAGGHIFHPLWIDTSPPSIGSARVRTKPASPIIRWKTGGRGKRRMLSTR